MALAEQFGPDRQQIENGSEALTRHPSADTLNAIYSASEPRRQQLFRRLNLAPGGTAALIEIRSEVLTHISKNPELTAVDCDFVCVMVHRGFSVLRPIDWTTPANILEKIIQYEAVHEIHSWDHLRDRLQPGDKPSFSQALQDAPLRIRKFYVAKFVSVFWTACGNFETIR